MAARLARLGRWAARHRRRVVAVWLVLLIATGAGAATAGGEVSDAFSLPGTESQEGADLLTERFPAAAGSAAQVVVAGELTADDRPAVEALRADLAAVEGVASVDDPYAAGPGGAPVGLSPEGDVGRLSVQFPVDAREVEQDVWDEVTSVVEAADGEALRVEIGGEVASALESEPPGGTAEAIGVGVAVVVLLLTFGSLAAAGLPLTSALVAVAISVGGVLLAARFVDVPTVAEVLGIMIGLAVGIDYALFLVFRFREELRRDDGVEAAVGRTMATAGSAVIFAGVAVVLAMSGLLLVGIPFIAVMGVAVALTVVVALLAATTFVPALLALGGTRLAHPTLPVLRHREPASADRTLGARWARGVARHPWAGLVGSVTLLGVLSLPLLGLQTALPSDATAAESSSQRQAADLVAEGFGEGANAPLLVVVDTGGLGGVAAQEALAATADALRGADGVAGVAPPQVAPDGGTAVLQAVPTTGPAEPETADLVDDLRDGVLADVETSTGAETYVAGPTAANVDIDATLLSRLPLMVTAVVAVSFLLLMVAFRSVLVPLKAAVGILLSIGAALGVVVAVSQWGWGGSLVGLESTAPVISFLPVLAFAILFGLSMDYEVFILSRVRERWAATGEATASVVEGVGLTARVITAAAAIMVSVFGGFMLGDDQTTKVIGLGLAAAVLLDATVVRLVFVPSVMVLLGRHAWWLPGWLDRLLPHVDVEGEGYADGDVAAGDGPADGAPVGRSDASSTPRERATPVG